MLSTPSALGSCRRSGLVAGIPTERALQTAASSLSPQRPLRVAPDSLVLLFPLSSVLTFNVFCSGPL